MEGRATSAVDFAELAVVVGLTTEDEAGAG